MTLSTVVVTPANAAAVATDNTNFRDQERRAGALTYEYVKMLDPEVIELIKTSMNHDLGDTLDCRDIYTGFVKKFCSLTEDQYANYLELLREKYVVGKSFTTHIMKHMRVRSILNSAKAAHPQDMQIGELLHSVRDMKDARIMGHVMTQIAAEYRALVDAPGRIPEDRKFRTYCNLLLDADEQRRFGDYSPEVGAAPVEKVKTVEEIKLTETQTLLEAINKLVAATTAAVAKKAAPGRSDKSNRALRMETLAAEMQAKYGNGKYPLASPCPAHPGSIKYPCMHTWGECKLFLFVPDHGKKK
jgi:hypothetical protein